MPTISLPINNFQRENCIFSDEEWRKNNDKRSIVRRVYDFIIMIFRELAYEIHTVTYRLFTSQQRFPLHDQEIEWKNDTKGLCVFIHGLNGHPHVWDKHISLIQDSTLDIYAPHVHHGGRCSLDEAIDPLFKRISDYALKNPKSPISLMGVSNGGRLALALETMIRKNAPKTDVKVSTIASIHFGTPFIKFMKNLGLCEWVVDPIVAEEFEYGSKKAQEILAKVQEPIPVGNGVRSYEFFATFEDIFVGDLGCSLPKFSDEDKHEILQGYGHNSIVSAVAVKQVKNTVDWMHERNKIRKQEELELQALEEHRNTACGLLQSIYNVCVA